MMKTHSFLKSLVLIGVAVSAVNAFGDEGDAADYILSRLTPNQAALEGLGTVGAAGDRIIVGAAIKGFDLLRKDRNENSGRSVLEDALEMEKNSDRVKLLRTLLLSSSINGRKQDVLKNKAAFESHIRNKVTDLISEAKNKIVTTGQSANKDASGIITSLENQNSDMINLANSYAPRGGSEATSGEIGATNRLNKKISANLDEIARLKGLMSARAKISRHATAFEHAHTSANAELSRVTLYLADLEKFLHRDVISGRISGHDAVSEMNKARFRLNLQKLMVHVSSLSEGQKAVDIVEATADELADLSTKSGMSSSDVEQIYAIRDLRAVASNIRDTSFVTIDLIVLGKQVRSEISSDGSVNILAN